eukprot:TRINITY_DN30288_c0_g1_i1.p2 TRINITY_DN30288_c0_g1~~TRINITY_DN30288_c0_g1_i1.p2  ORF type:complete len:386 (+),score=103.04 TRINITY_DN30288_c0_g1_i1:591-1748(+)
MRSGQRPKDSKQQRALVWALFREINQQLQGGELVGPATAEAALCLLYDSNLTGSARALGQQLQEHGVVAPPRRVQLAALRCAARRGNVDQWRTAWDALEAAGCNPRDSEPCTMAELALWSLRGQTEEAERAFRRLRQTGRLAWHLRIAAQVSAAGALRVIGEMRRHGPSPNPATWTAALRVCRCVSDPAAAGESLLAAIPPAEEGPSVWRALMAVRAAAGRTDGVRELLRRLRALGEPLCAYDTAVAVRACRARLERRGELLSPEERSECAEFAERVFEAALLQKQVGTGGVWFQMMMIHARLGDADKAERLLRLAGAAGVPRSPGLLEAHRAAYLAAGRPPPRRPPVQFSGGSTAVGAWGAGEKGDAAHLSPVRFRGQARRADV